MLKYTRMATLSVLVDVLADTARKRVAVPQSTLNDPKRLVICEGVTAIQPIKLVGEAGFRRDAPSNIFARGLGGWEYPAFWAAALFIQFLLGDGPLTLVPSTPLPVS